MKRLFVTGIGTGVGKTVVAALLARALQADYWKPIQTGAGEDSDSETVRRLTQGAVFCHPEAVCLKAPLSPHAAAALENREIAIHDIRCPATDRPLVIEGAGGLLVPLNDRETTADLVAALGVQAVIVSRHYLGSINHTLLTFEALRSRGIPVYGIVFNGSPLPHTVEIIERHTGCRPLFHLPELVSITPETLASLLPTLPCFPS